MYVHVRMCAHVSACALQCMRVYHSTCTHKHMCLRVPYTCTCTCTYNTETQEAKAIADLPVHESIIIMYDLPQQGKLISEGNDQLPSLLL